jgi:DNA-directed RNA polymerase specialized sigma24 family protein
MSPSGSVTHWLDLLRAGESAAAQPLWQRYCDQLVRLARRKLGTASRRVADEEDVALSAFASFCRGAGQGRFPDLGDRDNLWRVLVVLTARKAARQLRDQNRLRRGGGRVLGEAELPADDPEAAGLAEVVGHEPTPEFAASVAEQCQRLLGLLGAELRQVALWKMEGHSNAEIAQQLGCIERTVERKLRVIRNLWEQDREP